jgi:hypothetical protein
MAFSKFTTPTGATVWINPEMVCTVYSADPQEYPTARTVIAMASGKSQAVKEPPEVCIARLS